jgi:hypothetical protein
MRIYSRAEWGARYAAGAGPVRLPVRELWLHHTVTPAPAHDIEAERRAMRQVEGIGQSRFGRGISYTFAVMPSGRVYEGTGAGRLGAHTGGRNSISHAIVLVGNYDTAVPLESMLRGVADLVRHGHRSGWWQQNRLTGGHRDVKATGCPGDRAYALIGRINAMAGTVTTQSITPPIPQEEDDDMRISLAAGEEDVFHIEPTTNGGRDSALGVKKIILVLNTHGGNRVPVHVYFQSERGPGEVSLFGGAGPYIKELENRPGGWLHLKNRGAAHVGGRVIEVQ